jgi:hypothetical protein
MMDKSQELGRYIQSRLRAKNISDNAVAAALNISHKTVQKIYPLKDIYTERLTIFCKLLDENVFKDFYARDESLAKIFNSDFDQDNKSHQLKDELIETQRKYILELEEKLETLKSSKTSS